LPEHPLARTLLLLELDAFPGLEQEVAVNCLMNTCIKLVADEASLATAGGQTALVASFISLAQMGLKVTLDVPDVPILGVQPPLVGATIRSALTSHAGQLIQPCADNPEHELALAIGSADPGERGYCLTSDGSTTAATMGRGTTPWQADDAVSGTMAGVLAGAAALPVVIRQLERDLDRRAPAQFRTVHERIVVSLPPITPGGHEIGDTDVISAGAITNATLFVLLRSDAKGKLRVFDDDRFEITSLNRYALARRSDIGRRKVERLEELSSPALDIVGVASRYPAPGVDRAASRVLVGADNLAARRDAQRIEPAWLHVGGTTHFEVISSAHPQGEPCAACVHPAEDAANPGDIPTISFVSMLAGALQAHALLMHAGGQPMAGYYCWATNLGGRSAFAPFSPAPNPRCPLRCPASQRQKERVLTSHQAPGPAAA
jgi:ThiF family